MLKIAQYSAQLENYKKAIEIYEEVSYQFSLTYGTGRKSICPFLSLLHDYCIILF